MTDEAPATETVEPKRGRGRPRKDNGDAPARELAEVRQVDRIQAAIDSIGPKTWETIKKTICKAAVEKGATDADVALFCYKMHQIGADPLSGRGHLLPFKNEDGAYSFSFVQGVELYVSRANAAGDLVRFQSAAVYSEDAFTVNDVAKADVVHAIKKLPRGFPVGAWAVAQRRSMEPAMAVISMTDIPERLRNYSTWKNSPAVMIEKTAVKKCLAKLYPDAQIADFPEELVEVSSEPSPRVIVDVPKPEPPAKAEKPAEAPPVVPAAPVEAEEPPKFEKATPFTAKTQDAFVGSLKKACASTDPAVCKEVLRDVMKVTKSKELSEELMTWYGERLEKRGVEKVEGVWRWKQTASPKTEEV